jgi:hypothetical protein
VIEVSAEGDRVAASELERLIKSLRDAILELRGVLDELSNPVVPVQLQPRAGGQPGRQPEAKAREEVRVEPHEAEEVRAEALREPQAGELVGRRELEELVGKAKALSRGVEGTARPSSVELGLERLAGLLRLVYELESRVPPEYLGGLVDILHRSGLIDEAQRDTVKKIIELARIGIEHGLGVDESIAILAALSKELGLDVTEITEELVKSIMQRRGSERWESQR